MYDDILDMLASGDPQERIRALKELAKTQDPALLKQISTVYKNDSNEEVRLTALKAGRYIRTKQEEKDAEAGGGQDTYAYDDYYDQDIDYDEEPQDAPRYEMTDAAASLGELTAKKKKNRPDAPVSDASVKRSQGLIDRAMNLSMSGDNVKAVEALRQAFKVNPNLIDDDYSMTVASDIMGLPRDEAIDELLYSVPDAKAKRGGESDGITWETALADLATYGIVVTIITFISGLLISRLLGDIMAGVIDFYSDMMFSDPMFSDPMYTSSYSAADMDAAIRQISNPSIPGVLVTALGYGVVSILGLIFWYAVLHFVAVNFMSGNGSFRKLVHVVTPFLSIVAVVQTVFYGIYFFVMLRGMGDLIVSYDGSFEQSLDVQRSVEDGLNMMSLISFIASCVLLGWYSKLIGKTYDFGTGKGCVTMFLSVVVMCIGMCGCIFVFSTALGSMFSSMTTF